MNKLKKTFLVFFLIYGNFQIVFSQFNCLPQSSNFSFLPTPASQNKFINWNSFPEFSLPFKIVFGGPRFNDQNKQPLKHGFSHLASYSGDESNTLPIKNRALIYYGVAYIFPRPQPWQKIRSPWANDIQDYRTKWRGEMAAYAAHFNDTNGTRSPAADMMVLDIERHWEGQFTLATDLAILGIKNDPLVPKEYSKLSDSQFVERYKRDMLDLYSEPLRFMKSDGLLNKFNSFSSYGDVPVRYQGLNIEGNQWSDWQVNTNRLSYLMKDTTTGNLGGEFYNQMNFLCPSVYIQTDYGANPKAKGGNYLAEMLFQIEVNKAWTKKDIIPFVWLRYEDFSLPYPRFVKSFQAEALAIFPFFAGAKGAILWDDSYESIDNTNFTTYEYYLNGLYKLSLYKSFFEGNFEYVQNNNARDLYANQLPVWRGIVKDGKILIAAQNPYATDNEITKLNVTYKKWSNTISLKGKEVFLCAFDLVDITANEPSKSDIKVSVLENPLANNILKLHLELLEKQELDINLNDASGKIIYSEKVMASSGESVYNKSISNLPKGVFILKVISKNGIFSQKIVN